MKTRKVTSLVALCGAICAFVLMFFVDGSGFLDLSELVTYILAGISFLCMVVAILIGSDGKLASKKSKIICLVAAVVLILVGVYAANYDWDGPAVELSMDEVLAEEPQLTGIVKEIYEHSILMESETAGGSRAEYMVSTDADMADSYTDFTVGDEVVVYYDGNVAESYPMQIHKVYGIMLKAPAE